MEQNEKLLLAKRPNIQIHKVHYHMTGLLHYTAY